MALDYGEQLDEARETVRTEREKRGKAKRKSDSRKNANLNKRFMVNWIPMSEKTKHQLDTPTWRQ